MSLFFKLVMSASRIKSLISEEVVKSAEFNSSSETQEQLVGRKGFSWPKLRPPDYLTQGLRG